MWTAGRPPRRRRFPIRRRATSPSIPRNDVVLEASAGTGKTRVLVDRYVRLLEAGVDPRHILAITFTRKAAAEMRERVLAELNRRAAAGAWTPAAWRALRVDLADMQISTIDAFCFALLREFPLEGRRRTRIRDRRRNRDGALRERGHGPHVPRDPRTAGGRRAAAAAARAHQAAGAARGGRGAARSPARGVPSGGDVRPPAGPGANHGRDCGGVRRPDPRSDSGRRHPVRAAR